MINSNFEYRFSLFILSFALLVMTTSLHLLFVFSAFQFVRSDDIICPSYPPTTNLDPSTFSSILSQVDEYIQKTIIKENNITGFITSIVYDQQLLFSKGYGLRNYMNESSGPPSGDDLVMIASNTKIFTALLTYYLRDNNFNVSLDDPITKYLPSFSVKSIYPTTEQLTLLQLLSHTAGLQDETPYPYGDVSSNETAILQALATRYLVYPPYEQFHYSNLGFALLGRAVEKIFCDGCYEELVKKLILNQLNFSKYSGFNYSQDIIDNHCAYGWYLDENGEKQQGPIATSYWDNPNGAMLASPNDMAKFMMFMFRDEMEKNNGSQVLDGMTIREMLKPKTLLNDGVEAVGTPFEMHYYPFKRMIPGKENDAFGVWYKGKQGEVLGYRSCTMMAPDYKLGVFTVALEDPYWISEGSVWANEILNMMLPELDMKLYDDYVGNDQYYLPKNYALLEGVYDCDGYRVNISREYSEQYGAFLVYDDGSGMYNFEVFSDEIEDVYRLGRDFLNSTETCFWGEIPQTNALLYFQFDDGTDKHATSILYQETFCKCESV